jgi:hypothetical protein
MGEVRKVWFTGVAEDQSAALDQVKASTGLEPASWDPVDQLKLRLPRWGTQAKALKACSTGFACCLGSAYLTG